MTGTCPREATRLYYDGGSGPYQIENLTFLPKAGSSGNVRVSYTGYSENERSFTGSILISVEQDEATLSYSSHNGAVIRFRSEDFFRYAMALTNRSLQYVTFSLPSARCGTLYYNYVSASVYEQPIQSSTRYYRTLSPSINGVAFVPNPEYAGNFTLSFTGYDTEGRSFQGVVRMYVNNPEAKGSVSSSSGEDRERLNYETSPGGRVDFLLADFEEECYDRTGQQLDYIYFTSLPSASRGTVYYNRTTEVDTGDEFNRSGSNRIALLSFEADEDYTGSFSINFTGVNTRGRSFTARIYIDVDEGAGSEIEYTVASGKRVYFFASDFSNASRTATGRELDYVRFRARPAVGSLYYGESRSVSTGTSYYRTGGASLLDNVNYAAPEGYTGTVSFLYSGYDNRGTSFEGRITIVVSATESTGWSDAASAFLSTGPAVTLNASEILAQSEPIIGDVVSIQLQEPDPAQGRLLTHFLSPGIYSSFDPETLYTADTLRQVSFLPAHDFSGTARIRYTARNRQNRVYSSYLRISVTPPTYSRYFSDLRTSDRTWAVPAVDFFRTYGVLNGVTPSTYEPDGPARRGAFVTVLARLYGIPPYPGNGGYEDVNTSMYYAEAIAGARAVGITDATRYFLPDTPITRQSAALLLYRCMERYGTVTPGGYVDLARFSDWYDVPYYAVEAMGALARMGVFNGDAQGRLNPSGTLTRLQMAAILYRAVA